MSLIDYLIKFNEQDLPENFVSIATKIENKEATHAAILIRHKSINYLHHFPGNTSPEVIEDFNEDGWYVYKIIEAINVDDEFEVGAFLQHCKRICNKSNITYSFIADGSSYNDRGEFLSRLGLPELGSCVGFCVNTLTGGLIDVQDSLFELDDWDDSEINQFVDKWAMQQVNNKYPDLDWSLYNAFKKRIKPIEYLCSSFIDTFPIRKSQIEAILPEVQSVINNKF